MTTPISPADSTQVPVGDTSTSTADDTGTASLLQPNTFSAFSSTSSSIRTRSIPPTRPTS